MTRYKCVWLIILLSTYVILAIKGTLFQPIAYTLPDGLQSVNGSSITGGCQESCVQMPISGTSINGCDCPGTTPVSGVLIDGDIPSIDTTQRGTWANGLFVVNRNGQDSYMIGFAFSSYFSLRELKVTYFDCPIWGAGVTTINVYSSFSFPSFSSTASTNIGMLSLVGDTSPSCTSLRTISIPAQTSELINVYFIEFSFTGGSSVHPLNSLHIGEVRFSDVPLSTQTTTTQTTNVANPTMESINPTSIDTTVPSNQTEEATTTHTLASMMDPLSTERVTHTKEVTSTSIGVLASTMDSLSTEGVTQTTTSPTVDAAALPVTTIIGAFVGVIVLLLLLILVSTTLMVGFFVYNKRKVKRLKDKTLEEPQYAVIEVLNSQFVHQDSTEHDELQMRRTSTALNSLYQQSAILSPPDPCCPAELSSGQEINGFYSEIRERSGSRGSVNVENDTNSDFSDVGHENHYARIPEIYTLAVDTITDDNMQEDSLANHYAIIPEVGTANTANIGIESAEKEDDQDSTSCGLVLQAKEPIMENACEATSCYCQEEDAPPPEDQTSYSLVHKQLPPPIPDKSNELQQYLEIKASTEILTDQQQHCKDGNTNEGDVYSESKETSPVRPKDEHN